MTHKFSKLAQQARERYKQEKGLDMTQSTNTQVVAPPVAKKAKYLRDADGNLYLWTEGLAQRGDLVAAHDPNAPEKYSSDLSQIALNRELEMARERADMQEVARLEAEKQAIEAEQAKAEAEALAEANARNLQIAEEKLAQERAENAKKLAEMQATIDALAQGSTAGKSAVGNKPTRKARKPDQPVKPVVEDSEDPVDEFE